MDNHTAVIMTQKEKLIRAEDEINLLRDENQRLRRALEQIADTETDWTLCADGNAQRMRNMAYDALKEAGSG